MQCGGRAAADSPERGHAARQPRRHGRLNERQRRHGRRTSTPTPFMKTTIALILPLFVAMPLAAQRRRATNPPIPFPGCTMVNGTPAVTFTRDEGRTLAAVGQGLTGSAR